jgi:molecular chaperone GrpE
VIATIFYVLSGFVVAASLVFVVYRTRQLRALERELEETRREHEHELEELHRTYRDRIDRLERECERAEREGHLGLAEDLFDGFDALEQAIDEARDADLSDDRDLLEGLEMVRSSLLRALERHDVEPVSPEPEDDFDPQCHEALRAVDPDDADPGTILRCHRPGYRFGDRILRPASVDVAVGREDAPDREPSESRRDEASESAHSDVEGNAAAETNNAPETIEQESSPEPST